MLKDSAISQERRSTLERRAKFQGEIENVMGEGDWFTKTPQSMQERYAEFALMRELRKHHTWHLADDAWKASLMPEHALVTYISTGESFFVIRACSAAVLLWRALQAAVNLWEPDPAASSLEWRCVLALEDWQDIPINYVSPLHALIEDPPFPQKPASPKNKTI